MEKIYKKFDGNIWLSRIQAALLWLFFLPLFFQLSGSIFTSLEFKFDSEGSLFLLPLPISSIFCFIGIAFLLRLEKSHFGMGIVFSIFMLMMLSIIVSSNGSSKTELSKFILLVQFILPMFALLLGGLYLKPESDYLRFEAVMLYVLLIIIPLEVASTFVRGSGVLHPNVFIFSLYQYLQYLPIVFIGSYFIAVSSLYKNSKIRYFILFLAPWMGVYLSASLSILATILAIFSTVISFSMLNKNRKNWDVLLLLLLFWISFLIYSPIIKTPDTDELKYTSRELKENSNKDLVSERAMQKVYYKDRVVYLFSGDIKERFSHWGFYGRGVFENSKIILFGHLDRLDRENYPSSHNYYLDFIYHFGVIPVLPFMYLIFITVRKGVDAIKKGRFTPDLLMLLSVVAFFVLVESFFDFSFRQPYPGMIVFFLWGALLTRFSELNKEVILYPCKVYEN